LENPDICTRVIEAIPGSDGALNLLAELSVSQTHVEARYDCRGQRYEPRLKLLTLAEEDTNPIRRGDAVLVSGGAKGIAAECAFGISKRVRR